MVFIFVREPHKRLKALAEMWLRVKVHAIVTSALRGECLTLLTFIPKQRGMTRNTKLEGVWKIGGYWSLWCERVLTLATDEAKFFSSERTLYHTLIELKLTAGDYCEAWS